MHATLAGATLLERDGKVLLVREGKPSVADTWNLPGGRLEPGEGPVACARREAKEETGLVVEPTSLVGVYLDRSAAVESDVVVFVFRVRQENGRNRPDDADSVAETRWVPATALDDLDLRERYVRTAVEDGLAGPAIPLDRVTDLRH